MESKNSIEKKQKKEEKRERNRKTKEEKKCERKLNSSLISPSQKTKKSLQIYGMQTEDGVFYLGNRRYIKIYRTSISKKDEKEKFVHMLCELSDCRMRITDITGIPSIFFLTVFFEGDKYAEIHEQLRIFEESINRRDKESFLTDISGCGINELLAEIHKNFTAEDVQFDYKESVKNKEDWHETVYSGLETIHSGKFITGNGKYGECLLADEYPARIMDEILVETDCRIICSMDFQKMRPEDTELLNFMIQQKYNISQEALSAQQIINFTFAACITASTEEQLKQSVRAVSDEFKRHGVLLSAAVNQELQVYESILSFGISDFRAMRNVNMEIISNFLI